MQLLLLALSCHSGLFLFVSYFTGDAFQSFEIILLISIDQMGGAMQKI